MSQCNLYLLILHQTFKTIEQVTTNLEMELNISIKAFYIS